MNAKRDRSPAPKSLVPDAARVPKLTQREPDWQRAPDVTPESALRAESRMKEVAERIRGGNISDLPKLGAPSVGTTGRGLGHDNSEPCHHWLGTDRLKWFGLTPPASGPLTGTRDQVLRDEFCSPLSTVVGATLLGSPLPEEHNGQFISWALPNAPAHPSHSSPNNIPGIGFSVRTARPHSVPHLHAELINVGRPQPVLHPVLVNSVEEGFEPAPGARPSLFIDFAVPQRAVALEFGYIGDKDHFEHEEVQLIPYDSAGNRILVVKEDGRSDSLVSDAKKITQPQIRANSLFLIGVRDQGGNITSVELRFEGLPDGSATQFVFRIWHEALPPVAVHQGTLVTEGGRNSFVEFTGALGQLPEPVDENGVIIPFRTERSRTIKMPFRCDRGVVMLRGFKLETLDQTPREVQRIAIEVNPRQTGSGVSPFQTPGVFHVERGGSISLVPGGGLITRERDAFGYRIHVYFTLVCWDSDQMDVAIGQGQQTVPLQQESSMGGSPLRVADPCSNLDRNHGNPTSANGCGPLFGALQGFEFRMPKDQEVDQLNLEIGAATTGSTVGAGLRPAVFVPITDVSIPDLRRAGQHVEWTFSSHLSGGDGQWVAELVGASINQRRIPATYTRTVRGAVVTGESLSLRSDSSSAIFINRSIGRRPTPTTFFTDPLPPAKLEGDLAFLGLGAFNFQIDGPIREIEIELKATSYDGHTLLWQAGGGLSTSPWIEGGGAGRTDGRAFPIPTFGALSRRAATSARLSSQPIVEFNGHLGMRTLFPTQFGAIRNESNAPALITGVQQSGPESDEFVIRLEHAVNGVSRIFFLRDLQANSPLVLQPGETLLVGGWFFPGAETGPNDPPRLAFLDFETNVASSPTIEIRVHGRTTPQDAEAEVLPATANFGVVRIFSGRPATRNVVLVSVGRSPLLVNSIAIEDASAGFSWSVLQRPAGGGQVLANGARYQLDPGGTLTVQIAFPAPALPGVVTPPPLGVRQTRLVFETNAGTYFAQLTAQGTNE